MGIKYMEVPTASLIDWYMKGVTIIDPKERVSPLPPTVFFDPVKQVFIFKFYTVIEEPSS